MKVPKRLHYETFKIDNRKYDLGERNDGGYQITSIHPYDETEYHWALLRAGQSEWEIWRAGMLCGKLAPKKRQPRSKEQVAAKLYEMDKSANLHRRGGIM